MGWRRWCPRLGLMGIWGARPAGLGQPVTCGQVITQDTTRCDLDCWHGVQAALFIGGTGSRSTWAAHDLGVALDHRRGSRQRDDPQRHARQRRGPLIKTPPARGSATFGSRGSASAWTSSTPITRTSGRVSSRAPCSDGGRLELQHRPGIGSASPKGWCRHAGANHNRVVDNTFGRSSPTPLQRRRQPDRAQRMALFDGIAPGSDRKPSPKRHHDRDRRLQLLDRDLLSDSSHNSFANHHRQPGRLQGHSEAAIGWW